MIDRIRLIVELDRPSAKSDDYIAGLVEGVFDYLHPTVTIIRPETADPLHVRHNEGEES